MKKEENRAHIKANNDKRALDIIRSDSGGYRLEAMTSAGVSQLPFVEFSRQFEDAFGDKLVIIPKEKQNNAHDL